MLFNKQGQGVTCDNNTICNGENRNSDRGKQATGNS